MIESPKDLRWEKRITIIKFNKALLPEMEKTMRKLAYLLPLFFIFSGCASKIAPGPYGKYSTPEVRFYEESDLKGKDVTNLGEIKGVDCGLTWWRISSSDNALAALIKEAKTKGANGVRSTVCEDTGMRVSPCQNSATCKGEAILIK